jgi:hypothetical protein
MMSMRPRKLFRPPGSMRAMDPKFDAPRIDTVVPQREEVPVTEIEQPPVDEPTPDTDVDDATDDDEDEEDEESTEDATEETTPAEEV